MNEDKIDKIILKHKTYLNRHYISKNILKRLLLFFLGYKTFYNILYDSIDIGYSEGQKNDK